MEDLPQTHVARLLAHEVSSGELGIDTDDVKFAIISVLRPPSWDASFLCLLADSKNPTVPIYTAEFDFVHCRFADLRPYDPAATRVSPEVSFGDWQEVGDKQRDRFVDREGTLHAYGARCADTLLAEAGLNGLFPHSVTVCMAADRVVYLARDMILRDLRSTGIKPVPKPHGDVVGFAATEDSLAIVCSRKGSRLILYDSLDYNHPPRIREIGDEINKSSLQAVQIFQRKIYLVTRTADWERKQTTIKNWPDITVYVHDYQCELLRKVRFSTAAYIPELLLNKPEISNFLDQKGIKSFVPETEDLSFLNKSMRVPVLPSKLSSPLRPLALRSTSRPPTAGYIMKVECFIYSEKLSVLLLHDNFANLYIMLDNGTTIWHSDTIQLFSTPTDQPKAYEFAVRPDNYSLVAVSYSGDCRVLKLFVD